MGAREGVTGGAPPQDLGRGLMASLPLVPGVAAFGLIYGVMARQVGFSPCEAWVMSLIVHAGSAQFTVLEMWGAAGAVPIVLTTFAINMRHILMGASVASYLQGLSSRWKAFLALWMSDESYALAIAEFEVGWGSHWYFLGANVGIFLAWTTSGLVGALAREVIVAPERYGLDLVFPLTFMGLLAAFLRDSTDAIVAVVAGGLALLGVFVLPSKWYVVVASLLGSGFGLLLEEVTSLREGAEG
jgi:4-azaleucine resistance transporter AzlC